MPRLVDGRPRSLAHRPILVLGFLAIAAVLARPCPAQVGRAATNGEPRTFQGGDSKPVPPPAVVNAETFTRKPDAPLDGPPFTTVKAWAIADGATGEVLWGHREKDTLEMASTTKIMTALIVVRLMAMDPKVGDEVVTFSRRADRTIGSSSEVREGERIPVRELLYGLLLPSGNDAAVAFAEHFGGWLEPSVKDEKNEQPLDRFVAEMNRVAEELGLHETHFANPNGLPAPRHHSSARDLCRLAAHAMRQPVFAAVVGTRRHGCAVVAPDGNRRNVAWTNTNHLLEIEGYDGIKTGTTRAAGTCLVASGHRGSDHLIVVVLGGSSSPDSRYPDARNLFRWAWQKREHRSPAPHTGTTR